MPCHIYWINTEGFILGCNQTVANFANLESPEFVIGKPYRNIYPSTNPTNIDDTHSQAITYNTILSFEESIHLPNNQTICLQSYKAPLFNKDGNIIGIINISFDITKNKTELNYMRHIIEMLPGHVWWTNLSGELLGANKQMAESFELGKESDYLGMSAYNTLHQDHNKTSRAQHADKLVENDNIVIETGKSIKIEEEMVIHGKIKSYLSTKSPLKNLDGKIIGVMGIAQDITENRNERTMLKHILSILPGHVWWTDRDGKILGCNNLMAKHCGHNNAEGLLGKSTIDLYSSIVSGKTNASAVKYTDTIDQKVIQQDVTFEGEETGEINKEIRTFYSHKTPLKDLDGNITGLVGIAQDITELKETQEKLRIANEAKSEFIANMSHDLRTPITGMLSESEFIEANAENAEVRECGHFLKEATQQLLRLSNDVLEYVSLESGYFDDPITVFNPSEVVNDVMTLMRVSLRHKNLDFNTTIAPDVPKAVKGLGQYFERILSNLVANAIKFTTNGFVNVYLTLDSEISDEVTLKLVVEDTGIGIPADKYEEIFDQFAKLSSSYQGVYKGSGLGLYSVKQYVGQMQGRIKVDSVVGKGTKFIVTLPFDKAQAAQAIPLPMDRVSTPIMANNQSCEITTLDTSVNKSYKILIVEDSPLPARAVMRLLNDYDCDIKLVETGEEAVKAALKKQYDLILMDIGLPGIDGIEATRQIRALPENNHVPVVALTGHARGLHQGACLAAGMQEVYTKPLSRHQLKSMFESYIQNTEDTKQAQFPHIEKAILDVAAMMEQYAMQDPKLLLDILEAALDFIPEKLELLHQAIDSNNIEQIKITIQDLKGALSYLVVPEANDLLLSWDAVLKHEVPSKVSINNMYKSIEDTLAKTRATIQLLTMQLKK